VKRFIRWYRSCDGDGIQNRKKVSHQFGNIEKKAGLRIWIGFNWIKIGTIGGR
jgi:hypothetical protein